MFSGKVQDVSASKPFASFLVVLTLLYLAWLYGSHVNEEESFSREAEAATAVSSKAESSTEEAPKGEVVIAVMGVTGSGKSTFIRTMTGDDSVHVGHGLESGNSILFSEKTLILHMIIQIHRKSIPIDLLIRTLSLFSLIPPASMTRPAAMRKL